MKVSKKLIGAISLLVLDLLVFVFCGLFMMGYDDFYDESQGEYFSFSSMALEYKIVWTFYNIWLVVHAILAAYILYKFYKKYQKKIIN